MEEEIEEAGASGAAVLLSVPRRPSISSFTRAPHNRARGAAAERQALRWLRRQGYRVVEKNYRVKVGEIDLVATDGDVLCFVEIKARAGRGFGPAVGAVTPDKQRRIARVASAYLAASGWSGPCRFDVLGLESQPDGSWRFELIRDAFQSAP